MITLLLRVERVTVVGQVKRKTIWLNGSVYALSPTYSGSIFFTRLLIGGLFWF